MPDLFWNLSSLVRLDLSFNTFHGAVPPIVKKLCKLSVLNLSQNRFVGDLQSLMGNMSDCMLNSLKDLNLGVNQLNGSIPNKLGAFKKLERLFLLENVLSGPIPPSLGGLSSLKELSKFHQTEESNLNEVFFKFVSFECKLSMDSSLPTAGNFCKLMQRRSTFSNWLQTQSNLLALDLSNSSIRDTTPEWYVMVNSNKFEGSVTSFPSNVQLLDLSDNLLSGNVTQTNNEPGSANC
ncbi:leucine-rich repeat domain, L domain-like protein [Artemisia annua]|uniref:Leucine-rich repeat domain, L domain-like protein n=1 Tax=Artemisia annua TaxID=35608 RepID=A0A2U1MUV2_ARTAN|nr:leucine-rich repeat domain, L domain-like protein [Artemisia annua]